MQYMCFAATRSVTSKKFNVSEAFWFAARRIPDRRLCMLLEKEVAIAGKLFIIFAGI
jgi:hypothetical protein